MAKLVLETFLPVLITPHLYFIYYVTYVHIYINPELGLRVAMEL